MMKKIDHDVLWLGSKERMNSPASNHAILWPAYEFTVMSYESEDSGGLHLNPFEKAIFGLAKIGVVEIKKQAKHLHLHESFVAHVHTDLVTMQVLDGNGRVSERAPKVETKETPFAYRIYQDPWTGNLWPQLGSMEDRKTMIVQADQGKVALVVGTSGDPHLIKAFEVSPPHFAPEIPTTDDAFNASREQIRNLNRIKGGVKKSFPQKVKLLPETRQLVYLCCLNHKGEPGKPQIEDPFGDSTWRPFVNGVTARAEEIPSLARWIYRDSAETDDFELLEENPSLSSRILDLERKLTGADHGSRNRNLDQVRLDILSLGHEAIDLLWSDRTENFSLLLLGEQVDFSLISALAKTMGFEFSGLIGVIDLKSVCETNSGSLRERCVALLFGFRSDISSTIHRLSGICPDLFGLLEKAEDSELSRESDDCLIRAVSSLVKAAQFLTDENFERRP